MGTPPDSDFLIQALPLLLHDHDCLIVPGLGGFVAHPVAARYDADKGEWVPPGRDVAFNAKLTVRDGLLEQEIRRATGCTNDAAAALIDSEVAALRGALQQGNTRDIPGLGRLYLNDGGSIGFAPEPRLGERYSPPGLSRIPWIDLHAVEAEEEVGEETVTAEEEETTPVLPLPTGSGEHWTRPLARIAAVIALPLFLAGSIWWGGADGDRFSFLKFSEPLPTPYIPRLEGEDIRFPEVFEDTPPAFIDPDAPELAAPTSDEALMPLPVPRALSSGCSLHVIAGTFSAADRAAALARRFESLGYSTSLLPGPGGSLRVSTGCFDKKSEARRFLNGLETHHGIDQAWILAL